ncbi:MAG: hypothetical protein ACF788_04120, partial [Novipirellula sp. JB048]
WWQLSRGREVASGSFAPSRSLLTLETTAEADWLGGVPVFLLFQSLGGNGLMLCRVLLVAGGLIGLLAPRRRGSMVHPWVWGLVTLAMITLAERIDWMPGMFDALAMFVLVALMHRDLIHRDSVQSDAGQSDAGHGAAGTTRGGDRPPAVRRPQTASMVTATLLFIVWSNLSPAILAGLIGWLALCLMTTWAGDPARRANWILAIWMGIGGSLNPRGVLAWSDSLSAIAPTWQNHPSLLSGTPWQPLYHDFPNQAAVLFAVLSVIWIVTHATQSRRLPRGLFCFAWMQCLAWSSIHNLHLATVWMAGDLLFGWYRHGGWIVNQLGISARGRIGLLAAPLGIALAPSLLGLLPAPGWGVAAALDNRMLQMALRQTDPYGTAFADDTRSGGMLAWELGGPAVAGGRPRPRLQDIALRAVITGRFAEHRRVIDDLREQRLMSYWLTDGSRGGYWLSLEDRGTTLLAVSNRDTELIAGLEPSIWKPLSLDSPVLPYAAAGDEAYARRMVETLTHREIVEFQRWQYAFPSSTGSIFDRDRWGLKPLMASAEHAYRQAEVFRAMGLRYAALRVLVPARERFPDSRPLVCAMTRCQTELAEAEIIAAGSPSWFRYFAATELLAEDRCPPSRRWDWAVRNDSISPGWTIPERSDQNQQLYRRVTAYLRHGPQRLVVAADFQTPPSSAHAQLMYAGLCGAVELGDHSMADRYLQWFEDHPSAAALQRLVEIRLREVHPPTLVEDGS